MQHPGADAVVFIIRIDASPHPRVDGRAGGGPYFDITSHLSGRCEDKTNIFSGVETRRDPFCAESLSVCDLIPPNDRMRPAVKEYKGRFHIFQSCAANGKAFRKGYCHIFL